jgi:hypothetical protein
MKEEETGGVGVVSGGVGRFKYPRLVSRTTRALGQVDVLRSNFCPLVDALKVASRLKRTANRHNTTQHNGDTLSTTTTTTTTAIDGPGQAHGSSADRRGTSLSSGGVTILQHRKLKLQPGRSAPGCCRTGSQVDPTVLVAVHALPMTGDTGQWRLLDAVVAKPRFTWRGDHRSWQSGTEPAQGPKTER